MVAVEIEIGRPHFEDCAIVRMSHSLGYGYQIEVESFVTEDAEVEGHLMTAERTKRLFVHDRDDRFIVQT